jgi:hypothetical protein
VTTFLLSVLPILSVLSVFAYAAATGIQMYRVKGQSSVLGIAVALAGFTAGRLLDRFAALPRGLDDWVNYRDQTNNAAVTRGDRLLAVLSVEVALLFLFAAVIGLVAIWLVRRDLAPPCGPAAPSGERRVLAALFVLAVGITARAKLATFLAFLMAKGHLL